MYQALYRKWRPRTFDDVVGQGHITDTLRRQLMSGRLSHAYLFVGTRGTGKTTCAKLLARVVNCERPENGNPCNSCPACRGIESGAVLDVEELDAASNNGVDNIRTLREEAVFTPATVKKRVYIIDEVHMLSPSAFNALLKILEEPPEHLIFILATTELQKVPATILSRCQRFSFRRISPDETVKRLKYIAEQEKITVTDGALSLLSRLADGSMRDALSLLDQCASKGEVDEEAVYTSVGLTGAIDTARLLGMIVAGDACGALSLLDKLYFGGKDPAAVLSELASLCRDVLVSKVAPTGGAGLLSGNFAPRVIDDYAKRFSRSQLLRFVSELQSAAFNMARSPDRRITAEICIIELSDSVPLSEDKTANANADKVRDEPEADQKEKKPVQEISRQDVTDNKNEEKSVRGQEEAQTECKKTQSKTEGDIWPSILEAAKSALTATQRMILDSRDNTAAEFSKGVLTVFAKNQFAENIVNATPVKTVLKETTERLTGCACTVRVEKTSGSAGVSSNMDIDDKLEKLGRFANVKFE